MFDISSLAGELGGLLAGAWGAGAVMGWGFAQGQVNKRIDELNAAVANLRTLQEEERDRCAKDMAAMREVHEADRARYLEELAELRSRADKIMAYYLSGVNKQQEQVRQSAVEIIEHKEHENE